MLLNLYFVLFIRTLTLLTQNLVSATGALLGRGFIDHKLNLNFFHVDDNLFTFNSFPWGRESYDYMVFEFWDSAFQLNSN